MDVLLPIRIFVKELHVNWTRSVSKEGYDLTDAERHILGSLDLQRLALAEEFWLDDRLKRFTHYAQQI